MSHISGTHAELYHRLSASILDTGVKRHKHKTEAIKSHKRICLSFINRYCLLARLSRRATEGMRQRRFHTCATQPPPRQRFLLKRFAWNPRGSFLRRHSRFCHNEPKLAPPRSLSPRSRVFQMLGARRIRSLANN